ncbi:MAG: uroporphyrinogen-III C-methyltransferase [Myxococcales bacterium]|nr:uroporphyrinogen-III C-methyltransferase [Myxococcales bacterium]
MTGRHKPGRVLLVGAGPGDPDLITVRGAQALRSADVVVYDALAAEQLLDLAPPEAQRINVGKRGHDDPTRPQEETTALLLRLAQQGKTVVRLKGGDPFVFGRGAEEASALAEAGIPFEIVPGVSSVIGALAYAGIPITDRRYSASFAVVTGHKDPTRVTQDTRWADLGRAADTLVILMGMRNLEGLVEKIIAGGLSPETPAAVVVDGTLPSQRVVEAPLKQLAERVRAEGLGAPAVVVIGNVVKLRQHLSWIERRPLFGRRVLVTRTPEQASEWMEALRAAGADPQLMPMLRIEAASDLGPLDAALGRLHSYDALLITSANAIRFLAARARERDVLLREFGGSVVCVGPKSAEATLAEGLPVQTVPAERFDAEGMLDAIEKQFPPAGRRFLLPQAEAARETLCEGLRAAGAMVDAVTAYRTLAPDTDAAALCERLTAGRLDVLTFASPSAVRNFMALLDRAARRAVADCLVAAIGPTTAEALRKEGLEPDVVPERANAADLVAALVEACGAGGSS